MPSPRSYFHKCGYSFGMDKSETTSPRDLNLCSLSVSVWKCLLTSPASPQPGSSRLTFTTLDTRTGGRPLGSTSPSGVQMMSMASLTSLRNSLCGRRWSLMNTSSLLAWVLLSFFMMLKQEGAGQPLEGEAEPCRNLLAAVFSVAWD